MKRALLIFLALGCVALAAPFDLLPMATGLSMHEAKIFALRKNPAVMAPWKPGDRLPESFMDAGLTPPVRLVANDGYTDGGSAYYLFEGSNGKYLVVCTDSPIRSNPKTKKVLMTDIAHLYLGAFHFTQNPKLAVPIGSKTERFLLDAINEEVKRLDPKGWANFQKWSREDSGKKAWSAQFMRKQTLQLPAGPKLEPLSTDLGHEPVGQPKPSSWKP